MGNFSGRGLLLAVACTAQFMVVLDVSVVNVALPSIQTALAFATNDLPWVVNAYALVFAGFLLLGGRLADVYGRRRVFLLGLLLFSGASLVGGLAWTPGTLIAARAVQGLGAAILAPTTLTLLTTTYAEGPLRTRALALWTAVGLGGGTAGNLAGGALTEWLSWRATLLVNIPIGAFAGIAALMLLPADRRENIRGVDFGGAALATVGMAALTFGITRVSEHGDSVAAGAALIGMAGLAGFALAEYRTARVPLMPPRLLRSPGVVRGNAAMLLAGACLMPMWYFLTLTMQHVLGYGPLRTGLGFLPHTLLTIAVGVGVTPRLMRTFDARVLITTGCILAATGFAWQSRITPDSGYLGSILGPALLISAGGGLLNTPLTTTVTSGVSESDAGAASGLMNTAKQFGGALGLAALVTLAAADQYTPAALAADYGRAFLAIAAVLTVVAAIAITGRGARRAGDPADKRGDRRHADLYPDVRVESRHG